MKQIWVDESFFIKIKTEASRRNKSIKQFTKELGRRETDISKKKNGIFPKL